MHIENIVMEPRDRVQEQGEERRDLALKRTIFARRRDGRNEEKSDTSDMRGNSGPWRQWDQQYVVHWAMNRVTYAERATKKQDERKK
jgi:hypothetical protein